MPTLLDFKLAYRQSLPVLWRSSVPPGQDARTSLARSRIGNEIAEVFDESNH